MHRYPGLALAALALALAGCAGPGTQPAAGGAAQQQGAAAALAGTYRPLDPHDKKRGQGQSFYLVRAGDQWRISFDAEEFRRGGGERLSYWPDAKMVALNFDRPEQQSNDNMLCDDDRRDRRKQGYTICTSAFRVKDTSGSATAGRIIAGLATAGLTEVVALQKGTRFERIDMAQVLAILERQDLDRQFWLKAYHERAAAQNASGLNDFVRRYAADDPEQLVGKARTQLAQLARNATILEQAERDAPTPAQYRQRYTPVRPQKYCEALKPRGDDYRACQSEAPLIVAALAERRAAAARRTDVCHAVAKAAGAGRQAADCQAWGDGSCRAAGPQGQQVCDILNRKGQS